MSADDNVEVRECPEPPHVAPSAPPAPPEGYQWARECDECNVVRRAEARMGELLTERLGGGILDQLLRGDPAHRKAKP